LKPLVSIGVPLYNAEKHVANIRRLWNQSYPNIEVIISDNGSTDRTALLARKALRNKKNATFRSYPTNRGLSWNFNRTFRMARGKYFMWASLDDRRAPNYIEKCVEVMESSPAVVLAVPTVHVAIENCPGLLYTVDVQEASRARSLSERLSYALGGFPAVGLYGLFRAKALARTRLMSPFPGGDLLLIPEIALLGEIRHVAGTTLTYFGRKNWNSPKQDYQAFTGKKDRPPCFPGIRIWREHIFRIGRTRFSKMEKSRLLLVTVVHLQKALLFRFAKRIAQVLPGKKARVRLLERLYPIGFKNPGLQIQNLRMFRKRVIHPVMGALPS
jgi:glycosyltransferase involved in cell wall biosynthesis